MSMINAAAIADPHAALLRDRLVDQLAQARVLLPGTGWHQAFGKVARHVFVDRFQAPTPTGVGLLEYQVSGADRASAVAAAYAHARLIIQRDALGLPTCVCPTPAVIAAALMALDAGPGHRVLEVGTGTGYTTGLLCERLGDQAVTTIEIHPEMAENARAALTAHGYHPNVLCGNGDHGHHAGAPFDRILATCSVAEVPWAWIDQLRPGGVLVAAVGRGLVRLVVDEAGTASGQFLADIDEFVPMRTESTDVGVDVHQLFALATEPATEHQLSVRASMVGHSDMCFLISVALGGVEHVSRRYGGCDEHLWYDLDSGSWARALLNLDRAEVTARGSRDLWSQAYAQLIGWERAGRPRPDRYGLTVTPHGHRLWLDSPEQPVL